VWERQPARFDGAVGYVVTDPDADTRRDYARICDASGDSGILDALVARLARGGEVVLAGFYEARVGFDFAPAFIREARFRIATEFSPADLAAVVALVQDGKLSLDGLLTHQSPVAEMGQAYRTAFTDPHCLKMVLDWRSRS
jgi:3-hydroxyethyl bacteriochlorophyllide a dehydrogenase